MYEEVKLIFRDVRQSYERWRKIPSTLSPQCTPPPNVWSCR